MASPLRQIIQPEPLGADPAALNTAMINLSGVLQDGSGPAASMLVRHALDLVREAETVLVAQRQRIHQLERLSATDDLTGLENRRGVLDHLRRHLAAARRHGETGVLALCDLDGLKQINDRLGHPAGDAALCRFASMMRRSVRETDIVGRLGGDEFAILLTRCDVEGGLAKIDTLRSIADAASLCWQGQSIPLKASFGAVAYRSGAKVDALIAAADAALYENKAARRDRNAAPSVAGG